MGRKLISLTLCGVLLSGAFTGNIYTKAESVKSEVLPIAAEDIITEPAVYTKNEPSEKSLETAIKATKAKIQIPKEYSEFNFYYYGTNTYSNTYWSLNWKNPNDYSYIEVNLDKENNIIYYYNYDGSKTGRNIPSYLKKELLDKAEDFIRIIAPEVYSNMELVEANYNGIYSNTYSYLFQRKEKGVIFPDNTVTVRVDAQTGEVMSASINWLYGAKIPPSGAKLTKEEASKIIGDNLNMKLSYKTNYIRIFENGQYETVKKAFLVYEPDIPYISVDANTGEVYLTKTEWVELKSEEYDTVNKEMLSSVSGGSDMLTEEEMAKIRELEKLISKEKAIEIVTSNPHLHIDENLIAYTATLNRSYANKSKDNSFTWRIELRDERPVDYDKDGDNYRAYAHATVDAKTGKILSFSASIKSNYNRQTGNWLPVNVKYDREYGQNILEEFLKSQIKDRFAKTKLVDKRNDYIAYYKDNNEPVYGGYHYTYNRFNEGVEFSYNGIYGAVDGVTGKIYSYHSNWDDDIIFESPKNAMTPKEAFEHFIGKDGFNLLYEINIINQYDPNYKSNNRYYDYSDAYSVVYEIRLVYRPDIYPRYISPFTGEQLDGSGEVYKNVKPYIYDDITDTKSNREILLLADMNIGFEGRYFNPDKAVTEGEIIQLLEKLGYYNYGSSDNTKNSSKLITREELAYDFVKRLGFEKVAKLSGIYKTGYYDESNIHPDYLGAVALAKGLKLFPESDGNLFNPKNNVTRREIVHLILNFIKADNNIRY